MRIVPHFVAVSSVNFKIYQMVRAGFEPALGLMRTRRPHPNYVFELTAVEQLGSFR